MKHKISLILVCLFLITACKEDKSPSSNNDLSSLEKTYSKSPNGENISKLLAAYSEIIHDKNTSRKQLKATLDKAYEVAFTQNWDRELITFSSTYLREFPKEPGNEQKVLRLIKAMEQRNQDVTVKALKISFLEAYPESVVRDSIAASLDSTSLEPDAYLSRMAQRVFENPGDIGLNMVNAREYVNASEAVCLILPTKANTPRYLFNAAEISRTIKTLDKTLFLYDWIIEKYPQYEKAPTALFLKGFILENDLNNMDKAREVYRAFLEKYPAHDLADDVQFLYDNLGKSNEEILEMIEKNKDQ